MKLFLRRLIKSNRFWVVVSILLSVWIVLAIVIGAVVMAQNNPASFLSIAGPMGLSVIGDLLSSGFLPGILLFVALTMRNIARHSHQDSWADAHTSNQDQVVDKLKTK